MKMRAFRPFCGTNSLEVGIPTSKSCVTHWRKHPSSDQPELRDALHRSIKKTDEKCRAFHPFCGPNWSDTTRAPYLVGHQERLVSGRTPGATATAKLRLTEKIDEKCRAFPPFCGPSWSDTSHAHYLDLQITRSCSYLDLHITRSYTVGHTVLDVCPLTSRSCVGTLRPPPRSPVTTDQPKLRSTLRPTRRVSHITK